MTDMAADKPADPEQVALFQGVENLPGASWDDLAGLDATGVCRRAGVRHEAERGYETPFLGTPHWVDPMRRTITVPERGRRPGFQAGLVLLNYLTHASEAGVAGRMVTARELNGGALFFQGPHALSTGPVVERFGRSAEAMVRRAAAFGATPLAAGDGAFRLLALPKLLLAYTLYEADEEFPARLTVTFDAYADRHLSLDGIWALVNVLSARLAE